MPKVKIFNGGLRTALSPHLIREDESVVNNNVNHTLGVLESIKDSIQAVAGASKYGHFFTDNSTWYWSATPKDWVEFQERLYIGNRTGVSTKIIVSTEFNLGIQKPTTIPTIVVNNETIEQNQITRLDLVASADVTKDIPAGITLSYKVVNIDASGNFYPSDTTFTIRVTSLLAATHADYNKNKIAVDCTDTNINTEVAIFRFFDNYWRKIFEGTTPTGIIDDTYDISANDVITDYEVKALKGTYQYALTFYNSTDGTESVPIISAEFDVDWGTTVVSALEIATDPQVDERKLYRIGGASTIFTLVATLDNIVITYTDLLKDDELEGSLLTSETNFPPLSNMKFLMESYAMLFAAVGDKLVFTPIGQPDYWPQTFFLDFPRIITGLAKTPIGILVFNQYETWLVTGTGPLSLAQQLLTGSQGCVNGDSVVNIEGAAYFASTDGICISDGGKVVVLTRDKLGKIDLSASINAVVYDEQYYLLKTSQGESLIIDLARRVIKTTTYNIDSFIIANDRLYGFDGVTHLDELETAAGQLSMNYRSPQYIGRGLTIAKVYKNIYVFITGTITVKIFIDEILVQTDTKSNYGNHQIKIPSESSRGFSIQFEISGLGTVYEIRWEDGNANE